jgi:hypothetical protein
VRLFLWENLFGWRNRNLGTVDCRGGKVNYSRWRCRVAWIRRSVCNVGRVQIFGAGHRDGRPVYRAHAHWKRGAGYTRGGRIHCPFIL